MKRFLPTLLLALPFIVAMLPAVAESSRTIDVTVSRYASSPERIEVRRGETVRLNVTSTDGEHGFQIRELGLDARIPADGKPVMLYLTANEAGTFEITCSRYCGGGHGHMKAWLIVTSTD